MYKFIRKCKIHYRRYGCYSTSGVFRPDYTNGDTLSVLAVSPVCIIGMDGVGSWEIEASTRIGISVTSLSDMHRQ
ncbi:hypothetical protein [Candidatus Steffania adelgidicola]|uniref:hypothetical protein n=1 Tax=Candidatus Steffania adelgidicola TaxID=1076626 RepID=UPI001D0207E6|nr:hypothetical protein [Candidatus Steffania adelgidicola]